MKNTSTPEKKTRERLFVKSGVVKVHFGGNFDKTLINKIKRMARNSGRSLNAEVEILLARGVLHPEESK